MTASVWSLWMLVFLQQVVNSKTQLESFHRVTNFQLAKRASQIKPVCFINSIHVFGGYIDGNVMDDNIYNH